MSDYKITLQDGIDYTTEWRTEHPTLVKGFKIDKAEVDEIFANEDAVAMRTYLGLDSEGDPKLVIVGVDAEGKDITSTVYDLAEPCPSVCDETSVLCVGE
jgi:hypothetical protein